jgi:hypothetical protein
VRAAVLALALVGCGWTKQQVALGAASTAMLTVDWYQSQGITRDCVELNPVIGPCGERVPLDLYFMGVMAANLALAHAIGSEWRSVWLGAMAGAEAATVWSNASAE